MLKRVLIMMSVCCLFQTTHAASTVVGWAVREAILTKMSELDQKATINSTADMAQTSTYLTGYMPVSLPERMISMRLTYSSDPLLHSFQSTIEAIRQRKWTNAYINEYQYHMDELNAARFYIEWLESNNYHSFGMCFTAIKQKRQMLGYYTKASATTKNYYLKTQSVNPLTNDVSNVGTNQWGNVSGIPAALQQQMDTEQAKCIYDQTIKNFQANDYYGYTHPNTWRGVHAALAEQIKWELDRGYAVPGLVWTSPPTETELAELCTPQTCAGYDPDDPDGTGGGGTTDPDGPDNSDTGCGILDIPCNLGRLFVPRADWLQSKIAQTREISLTPQFPLVVVDEISVPNVYRGQPVKLDFRNFNVSEEAEDQIRFIAWWAAFIFGLRYIGLPVLGSRSGNYGSDGTGGSASEAYSGHKGSRINTNADGEIKGSSGYFGGGVGNKRASGSKSSGHFGGTAHYNKRGKK